MTDTTTFREWLATHVNKRGHWPNLTLGRIARHAQRYPGEWTTPEDLCDLMGAAGVNPNDRLVTYLTAAVEMYEAAPQSEGQPA